MSETEAPPAPTLAADPVEIAPGVHVIPDQRVPLVPNVGIVVGRDRTLVVDTGMGPANGDRALAHARALAAGTPLTLTITHFHPEHGFGAQSFAPVAEIVYNGAQLDELHLKGDGYVALFRSFGPAVEEALEGVALVDANETYEGELVLDLGGVEVRLIEHAGGHTLGDQVVWLPEARILFTGDLVENRFFPIFPFFPPDDADVSGVRWIEVLEALEALGPETVVPGHGEVGDAGLIAAVRGYLVELRDAVARAVDSGLSAVQAVEELEPQIRSRYPEWEQPEWVGFGIRAFHAELTAET
jgi:glyoxylase-like metal-dependent hydrolase (beta-lactamase superfamily II)